VKFWDSSGLVPLLVSEKVSRRMRALYRSDGEVVTWWGSLVECDSALARLEREGTLKARAAALARRRLDTLCEHWHEVQAADPLREHARRLLRAHPLRAGDALQLSAALRVAEHQPSTLPFVCLDERLSAAADREGFPVVGIGRVRTPSRSKAARRGGPLGR